MGVIELRKCVYIGIVTYLSTLIGCSIDISRSRPTIHVDESEFPISSNDGYNSFVCLVLGLRMWRIGMPERRFVTERQDRSSTYQPDLDHLGQVNNALIGNFPYLAQDDLQAQPVH